MGHPRHWGGGGQLIARGRGPLWNAGIFYMMIMGWLQDYSLYIITYIFVEVYILKMKGFSYILFHLSKTKIPGSH